MIQTVVAHAKLRYVLNAISVIVLFLPATEVKALHIIPCDVALFCDIYQPTLRGDL
jgi:hypothetical protein